MSKQDPAYFRAFEHRMPPKFNGLSQARENAWHFLAAATVGLGIWYLHWRWTQSLNPDALVFSIAVALAETLAFVGTLLFFFDIWREKDTPLSPAPASRQDAGLDGEGPIQVDVFITTYDEDVALVEPSIIDACALVKPAGVKVVVYVLDDGDRADMRELAQRLGVGYLRRSENLGFKAGNIRNALFQTDGDFVVICDADTRVLPNMLINTLGYFRDPNVAWVQTPHWFYDIPDGARIDHVWRTKFGVLGAKAAQAFTWVTGRTHTGADPFLSDPGVFFDVIQRRRNRHGASFCCGAGSIHRREAIFAGALQTFSDDLANVRTKARVAHGGPSHRALASALALQPFRFHVSEDIYTSILLHSDPHKSWRSVYHPQAESRMLSPWSIDAWAAQRLKYAGGTFDILLRGNPLWHGKMTWQTRLHYAATFWSYLGTLWMPVLLLAPVISLFAGVAAVESYSLAFFAHLLPLLLVNELALSVACKGHNTAAGTTSWLSAFPLTLRAFCLVARGRPPKFKPTPKTPGFRTSYRHVMPNIALLVIFAGASIYGLTASALGSEAHSASFLVVNLFWVGWNTLGVSRIIWASRWRPNTELSLQQAQNAKCATPEQKVFPHVQKAQPA